LYPFHGWQLREANEEVGLPLDDARIYPLTTFLPFLSKYGLIVHAHVVFVADHAVIKALRPSEDEVDRIWEVPLAMFLAGESPALTEEGLSEKGSEDWLYSEDRYNRSDIEWKVRALHSAAFCNLA
jgi:coenzyme A diphosphatase NUDT7